MSTEENKDPVCRFEAAVWNGRDPARPRRLPAHRRKGTIRHGCDEAASTVFCQA